MAYLRKAVDRQKSALINQLIKAGAVRYSDRDIYKKTLTELEKDYQFKLKEMTKGTTDS